MKYNIREKSLVKNVRKLIDMMTHPSLYTLLTEKEHNMIIKIKEEIKKI